MSQTNNLKALLIIIYIVLLVFSNLSLLAAKLKFFKFIRYGRFKYFSILIRLLYIYHFQAALQILIFLSTVSIIPFFLFQSAILSIYLSKICLNLYEVAFYCVLQCELLSQIKNMSPFNIIRTLKLLKRNSNGDGILLKRSLKK